MARKAKAGEARAFLWAALTSETDDCILWPFGLIMGYAQINKGEYGHHFICEQAHGPRPPGYEAAHNCGVPACINPRHLRWATAVDNQADRLRHGTSNRGERHGLAKLTAAEVLAIRAASGFEREIGEQFGVARTTVSAIRKRRRWRHL